MDKETRLILNEIKKLNEKIDAKFKRTQKNEIKQLDTDLIDEFLNVLTDIADEMEMDIEEDYPFLVTSVDFTRKLNSFKTFKNVVIELSDDTDEFGFFPEFSELLNKSKIKNKLKNDTNILISMKNGMEVFKMLSAFAEAQDMDIDDYENFSNTMDALQYMIQ